MNGNSKRVQVHILDKEFQVACRPEEKEALLSAAEELNDRMRAVRSNGSIVGLERIAVMVALNLVHELREVRTAALASQGSTEILERLARKLDQALPDAGSVRDWSENGPR